MSGKNKGPEPVKTTRHTEQCPWCKWWFTPAGIKKHRCWSLKAPVPGASPAARDKAEAENQGPVAGEAGPERRKNGKDNRS